MSPLVAAKNSASVALGLLFASFQVSNADLPSAPVSPLVAAKNSASVALGLLFASFQVSNADLPSAPAAPAAPASPFAPFRLVKKSSLDLFAFSGFAFQIS